MKRLRTGLIISYTLFFVFCGLSLLSTHYSSQDTDLGFTYRAPENLRSAAESFKIQYASESLTSSTPAYADSVAWTELNEKLNGYSKRLELLQDQQRSQKRIFSYLYLAAAMSMFIFSLKLRKIKTENSAK